MKYLRTTVIAFAIGIVSVGFGVASMNSGRAEESQRDAFCQRCGDGYCARSCENEKTCPQDCAPGGTSTAY